MPPSGHVVGPISPTPSLHTSSTAKPRSHSWFRPTLHEWELSHPSLADSKALFNSRDIRKGRIPLRFHHHSALGYDYQKKPIPLRVRYENEKTKVKPRLWADISFHVALWFTLGSCVWVANGFTVFLPILRPQTESNAVSKTAAALAFIGGTLFEVGAYLGLLEAGNRGKHSDFGSELDRVLYGIETSSSIDQSLEDGKLGAPEQSDWSWLPAMRLHEIGYVSALVQMFAATIFWVSTITGLPGVISGFAEGTGSVAIVDVFFWVPQVIGGTGFVISAGLLMIEVQPKWWYIKPLSLGWQIGLWNVLGAVGFLLCGALGMGTSSKAIYQSDLWTFIGSWAFLVGSCFQMYEACSAVPA